MELSRPTRLLSSPSVNCLRAFRGVFSSLIPRLMPPRSYLSFFVVLARLRFRCLGLLAVSLLQVCVSPAAILFVSNPNSSRDVGLQQARRSMGMAYSSRPSVGVSCKFTHRATLPHPRLTYPDTYPNPDLLHARVPMVAHSSWPQG